MATNSLTALITGGTSGIGRATAKRLAKLGIHVLVVGRNAKRGDETLAEIRAAGGKADFISSDLRNASSAREVAKRALELGDGHVDILINNAGVFPFGPTDKTTEEEFDRVYSLNAPVDWLIEKNKSGYQFFIARSPALLYPLWILEPPLRRYG